MPLILTEEQELLRDAARDFVSDQCAIDQLRLLRDQRDAPGFDTKLWKEMAGLGWLGVPFPEEFGGEEGEEDILRGGELLPDTTHREGGRGFPVGGIAFHHGHTEVSAVGSSGEKVGDGTSDHPSAGYENVVGL